MKTLILAMTFGLLIVVGTLSARAEHGGCVVRHLSDLGCECDAAAQCRKVCKLVKKEKESKKTATVFSVKISAFLGVAVVVWISNAQRPVNVVVPLRQSGLVQIEMLRRKIRL